MIAENFIRRTGIDASRTDLAEAFRRDPFGFQRPELRALVNFMRALPIEGKHFLVTVIPGQRWMLAQMSETRPLRPTLFENVQFESLEDAERHVFALRWERIFGSPLQPG